MYKNMYKILIVSIGLAALVGCKSKDPEATQKKQAVETAAAESPAKEETPNPEAAKPEPAKEVLPEAAAEPENGDTPKVAELPEQQALVADADSEDNEEDDTVPQDGTIEEKMAGMKWESGYVSRFDFRYEVPDFMKIMPPPANNDGSTYAWKDMVFMVWGAHDVLAEGDAKKAFDSDVESLGHAPHYKVVKSDNYIISDYKNDGKIFYRKCVYKYELEFCEELVYPKEYKEAVDPIVKKIAAFDVTEPPDVL
ncbi:MAG: hypothetical protein J6A01_11400 [Proteobacteria bacterium]|nr:hypothetical protein [Pseudomonadota bacterium]